jgi:uncharacterized protein (TIGR00255 family)
MTGFAQARADADGLTLTILIRTVNHRFLDLHLRLPPRAEPFEGEVERRVRKTLKRGRVDVTVTLEGSAAAGMHIDDALASAYVRAYRQLAQQLGLEHTAPDLNEVLRYPGVLTTASEGNEAEGFQSLLMTAVDRCVRDLEQMRLTEGEALARDIKQRLQVLSQSLEQISSSRDTLRDMLYQRLRKRMRELAADGVDDARLAQEAALLAERSDISEEITRFNAHLEQFAAALGEGGEVGKKLDFLLQEMNREVNTMLSKTSGIVEGGLQISQAGVQMKTEIEKIREQVQNIE